MHDQREALFLRLSWAQRRPELFASTVALGRSASVVETSLARRDDDWRAGIDVVALEPFRSYANGLLAVCNSHLDRELHHEPLLRGFHDPERSE